MLQYKIKETILALDIRFPKTWLMKVCGFPNNKSTRMANGLQKSITLADLSELCYQLNCTPNDLLYWKPDPLRPLPPTHPCNTKLTPPVEVPEWQNLFKNMYPDEVIAIKKIVEETIKNRKKRRH